MKNILILEGNTANLVAEAVNRVGTSPAGMYEKALISQDANVVCDVLAPYDSTLHDEHLENINGVVLTGSGVPWSVDAPQAGPLRDAVSKVFKNGIPILASCNGMQLGAVILGGGVGASPNGMEVGMARDINITKYGERHPLLKDRVTGYAVPCAHRDEVQSLPDKAQHLAGNQHSPIQAFSYEEGGIDFWGVQYHPEFTAAWVADLMRAPGTIWQNSQTADLLDIADSNTTAAKQLGVRAQDLSPHTRMTEVRNWLDHLNRQ